MDARAALVIGAAMLLAGACTRGGQASSQTPAANASDKAKQVAWDTHWSVSCDAPSANACGLLTQDLLGFDGARQFVRRQCDPAHDPDAHRCVERFRLFFIARMQARYSRGIESVSPACEELPIDCGNPVVYELVALTAHNYSLAHFPDAPYQVTTGAEAARAKDRNQRITHGVVAFIHDRIDRCDRGEIDCSCPEAGLGDAPCPEEEEGADAPLPALPEEPEERAVDWL